MGVIQSVFWFTGVLQSITWVLGILQPIKLILKPLQFIGRIQLNGLGIRLKILLSLKQVKSPLVLIQSKIYSLVYFIWLSLYRVLYRDHTIVTYLSFLIYTPQLQKRVYRLQIAIRLLALKIASVKSVKSSLYCSYRPLFINLQQPYLRILKLIQLLTPSADLRSTP